MVTEFTRVCAENDIPAEGTRLFEINDKPVVLIRQNGQVYALEGVCSHDGGIFDEGCSLADGQIECPRHGAKFDVKTGEATMMPAVVGIETYEVKVENGDVFVALNDE